MASFTIIGTGNMAGAIAGILSAGGSDVNHIAKEQLGTSPISGETVILAVPYAAVSSVLSTVAGQLDGKTVVDITNPVDFESFDSLVVAPGCSAASVIQAELPNSIVLKAFNTTLAATLSARTVGGLPTTVLIAGDDIDAKNGLAAAVIAGGVSAIDAGPLARAQELEALAFLQLTLAVSEKIGWTGGFAVAR